MLCIDPSSSCSTYSFTFSRRSNFYFWPIGSITFILIALLLPRLPLWAALSDSAISRILGCVAFILDCWILLIGAGLLAILLFSGMESIMSKKSISSALLLKLLFLAGIDGLLFFCSSNYSLRSEAYLLVNSLMVGKDDTLILTWLFS